MDRVLILLFVLLTLTPSFSLQKKPNPFSNCGGELIGDSDTFSYQQNLRPGELCVWTIHLETRTNFRFTVSDFNITSEYSDCRKGGLSFYSLTNLSPEGDPTPQTFCTQVPPASNTVFVANNVAVLVLYIAEDNPVAGTGFSLSWSATSTDPQGTKHVSSFTTAPQGAIQYPVIGTYEPLLAATWLVSAEQDYTDMTIESLTFEECIGSPDPCFCDALILYEVFPDGRLGQHERFCGERQDATINGLQGNMILALFTDGDTDDTVESGFRAIYFPGEEATTPEPTTTGEPATTTWGPITETPCGTAIISETTAGRIAHKYNQLYSPNERCVYTLRIPGAWGITFTLKHSGISESGPGDGVSIATFSRTSDAPLVKQDFLRLENMPILMQGNLAIISFISDSSNEGMGFVLEYRAANYTSDITSPQSAYYISDGEPSGHVSHPEEGNYDNYELSSFVITPPSFSVNGDPRTNVTWTKRGIESCNYDFVIYYRFYPNNIPFGSWSLYDTYCQTSPKLTSWTDSMLFLFKTDGSVNSTGFEIDWASS